MPQLSKADFESKYTTNSGGAAVFKDNTTEDISAADMRGFADDIADSLFFIFEGTFWATEGTTTLGDDVVINGGDNNLQFTQINDFNITTSAFGGSGDLSFNVAGDWTSTSTNANIQAQDVNISATAGNIQLNSTNSGITVDDIISISPFTALEIGLPGSATGDTYYRDSLGRFTRLGVGSTNQVLTVSGGLPAWASLTGSGVTGATSPITFSSNNISTSISNDRLVGRYTSGSGVMQEVLIGTGLFLSPGTGTLQTSMSTNRILGRTTAGTGVSEEISIGGGLVLSSGTLSGYILKSTTTIPAATFRSIGSSPVTLVAAPGAGFYINPISVTISTGSGSTAYDFSATEDLRILISTNGDMLQIDQGLIDTNASFPMKFTYKDISGGAWSGGSDLVENSALRISTADGGNATTGDRDVKVIVYYTIESM